MILEERDSSSVEYNMDGHGIDIGSSSGILTRKRGADELDGLPDRELPASDWKRRKWDDDGLFERLLTGADTVQRWSVNKTGVDEDVSSLLADLFDAG